MRQKKVKALRKAGQYKVTRMKWDKDTLPHAKVKVTRKERFWEGQRVVLYDYHFPGPDMRFIR